MRYVAVRKFSPQQFFGILVMNVSNLLALFNRCLCFLSKTLFFVEYQHMNFDELFFFNKYSPRKKNESIL